MSHYYSSIKGQKGEATRCGSKNSGISTHVRTWNFGIQVFIRHKNGKDVAEIYQTGGSNDPRATLLMIATKEGHL